MDEIQSQKASSVDCAIRTGKKMVSNEVYDSSEYDKELVNIVLMSTFIYCLGKERRS